MTKPPLWIPDDLPRMSSAIDDVMWIQSTAEAVLRLFREHKAKATKWKISRDADASFEIFARAKLRDLELTVMIRLRAEFALYLVVDPPQQWVAKGVQSTDTAALRLTTDILSLDEPSLSKNRLLYLRELLDYFNQSKRRMWAPLYADICEPVARTRDEWSAIHRRVEAELAEWEKWS